MEQTLRNLVPKIISKSIECKYIPHEGKSNLKKSIQKKLRAWLKPYDNFVILQDKDAGDCIELKQALKDEIPFDKISKTLIRIVCSELESWFLGDLSAIEKAFGISLAEQKNKSKFKNPDALSNASEEMKKLFPRYQKISGSKAISQYMDIDANKSHSFKVFVEGLRKISNQQ